MNSKEFIQALEDGKTVFLNRSTADLIHIAMSKHPNGTYVYMDVPCGIYVTCDTVEKATEHEILGKVEGIPVLTIRTEAWFA